MTFRKLPALFFLFTGGVIILLAALALIALSWGELAEPLILHFEARGGVDAFGTRGHLLMIWGGGVVMVAVNALLAAVTFRREHGLSYLLGGASIIFALLILIAVATVVSIN